MAPTRPNNSPLKEAFMVCTGRAATTCEPFGMSFLTSMILLICARHVAEIRPCTDAEDVDHGRGVVVAHDRGPTLR